MNWNRQVFKFVLFKFKSNLEWDLIKLNKIIKGARLFTRQRMIIVYYI